MNPLYKYCTVAWIAAVRSLYKYKFCEPPTVSDASRLSTSLLSVRNMLRRSRLQFAAGYWHVDSEETNKWDEEGARTLDATLSRVRCPETSTRRIYSSCRTWHQISLWLMYINCMLLSCQWHIARIWRICQRDSYTNQFLYILRLQQVQLHICHVTHLLHYLNLTSIGLSA